MFIVLLSPESSLSEATSCSNTFQTPESYLYRFFLASMPSRRRPYNAVLNTHVFQMFSFILWLICLLFHILLNPAITPFAFAILFLFLLCSQYPMSIFFCIFNF